MRPGCFTEDHHIARHRQKDNARRKDLSRQQMGRSCEAIIKNHKSMIRKNQHGKLKIDFHLLRVSIYKWFMLQRYHASLVRCCKLQALPSLLNQCDLVQQFLWFIEWTGARPWEHRENEAVSRLSPAFDPCHGPQPYSYSSYVANAWQPFQPNGC